MDDATEWFVERMGLVAEADGFSRIAGRLFGALLLSEAPRSLDDLAESLGVSKASASVEARRLLDRGVVERVGHPGDRRDYYQLAPNFFARLIGHRLRRWAELHQLVAAMRERAPSRSRTIRERFAYVDDVHAFVLARVHDALREWDEAHQRNTRDGAVTGRAAKSDTTSGRRAR